MLAKHYRFESIGGTSAGAIAATLTAAAEYARREHSSTTDPFDELSQIPNWLAASSSRGGTSNLFDLFQPQAQMKSLFKFATGFLVQSWFRRLVIWTRALWLELLVGTMPGGLLLFLASGKGWHFTVAVVLSVFVAMTGSIITATVGIIVRVIRLPKQNYGICTGYSATEPDGRPSLMSWLHERVNAIARLPLDRPLTFGDLRYAGIDLRMMTTCLTFGEPFTLPSDLGERITFYYSPHELASFVPPQVINWMELHEGPAPEYNHEHVDTEGLKRLPQWDDLPVIVATRLSLSFPVLFCAVPLYAIDYTRRRRSPNEPVPKVRVAGDAIGVEEPRHPERVWFSDGGITSNFPLHLFDAPLPRRPTFGINLRELRQDRLADDDRAWVAIPNSSIQPRELHLWTRLTVQSGIKGVGQLISSIFDASRNWMDNFLTTVPGYRASIVNICLDESEGGLNINMPPYIVEKLSKYGKDAAERLTDLYIRGAVHGMTWDDLRWTRLRSSMAMLETFLRDFSNITDSPESGDRSYMDLLDQTPEGRRPYKLSEDQRECAKAVFKVLQELGSNLQSGVLDRRSPRPTSDLGMRPRY